MNVYVNRAQDNKNHVVSNNVAQKKNSRKATKVDETPPQFVDNRLEATTQMKLQKMALNSSRTNQAQQLQTIVNSQNKNPIQKQGPEEEELLQGKFKTVQKQPLEEEELLQGKFKPIQKKGLEEEELLQGKFHTVQKQEIEEEELLQGKFEPIQKQENDTGLPDNLKYGIENLSGISMDDVQVHYGSDKPADLQAHAYAQGTDIHLAPGQEKHLPHEAWHVVQQKQGRVKPTMQLQDKVHVNDDKGLEKEADVMGTKAIQFKNKNIGKNSKMPSKLNNTFQLASIPGVNGYGNFIDLGNGLFGTTQVTNANEVAGLVNTIRQQTEHQNIKVLTGTHGTSDGHLVGEHKFYTEDMAHEGHKIQNGGWINVLDVVGKSKSTIEGWMKPGHSAIILAWCFSKSSVDNWPNVHHATKSPSEGGKWIW